MKAKATAIEVPSSRRSGSDRRCCLNLADLRVVRCRRSLEPRKPSDLLPHRVRTPGPCRRQRCTERPAALDHSASARREIASATRGSKNYSSEARSAWKSSAFTPGKTLSRSRRLASIASLLNSLWRNAKIGQSRKCALIQVGLEGLYTAASSAPFTPAAGPRTGRGPLCQAAQNVCNFETELSARGAARWPRLLYRRIPALGPARALGLTRRQQSAPLAYRTPGCDHRRGAQVSPSTPLARSLSG
jgi:hypothetical protein